MNDLPLLSWRPTPPQKRPRAARPGGRVVDPRLREELLDLVASAHRGKARAATWEQLRGELRARGIEVGVVRRLQEAAQELRAAGEPVVGISDAGVFFAETVEELDEAIEEASRRARRSLAHRSQLRAVRLKFLGQQQLGGGRAA